MLLKIHYGDVKDSGIRGLVDGKRTSFYMIVIVDETNIDDAVSRMGRYSSVVAFEYVGNIELIRSRDLGEKPVYIVRQLQGLGADVDFLMTQVPSNLRCVVEVPSDFTDMREVEKACVKYDNLHVTGGMLLNLPTVRLGGVTEQDLPKKLADSRKPIMFTQDANVLQTVVLEEVSEVEFFTAKVKAEKKERVPKVKMVRTPKTPKEKSAPKERVTKPKKQLATLMALVGASADEDNF